VWAVSALSVLLLFLGVVGIATLMLLVVRQRRAEIGLRRALGATPWDVALQFFLEGIKFERSANLPGSENGHERRAAAGVIRPAWIAGTRQAIALATRLTAIPIKRRRASVSTGSDVVQRTTRAPAQPTTTPPSTPTAASTRDARGAQDRASPDL